MLKHYETYLTVFLCCGAVELMLRKSASGATLFSSLSSRPASSLGFSASAAGNRGGLAGRGGAAAALLTFLGGIGGFVTVEKNIIPF